MHPFRHPCERKKITEKFFTFLLTIVLSAPPAPRLDPVRGVSATATKDRRDRSGGDRFLATKGRRYRSGEIGF